jgi:hypothetical protein
MNLVAVVCLAVFGTNALLNTLIESPRNHKQWTKAGAGKWAYTAAEAMLKPLHAASHCLGRCILSESLPHRH